MELPDVLIRLHADLGLVVQKSGGQFASRNVVKIFNAVLDEAKRKQPANPILTAIEPITADVRNEDLFIIVGQLNTIVRDGGI